MNDGLRVAPGLDTLVGGLADDAITRPASELGADHELRPDPRDVVELPAPTTLVVLGRRRIERGFVLGQRLETIQELAPDPGREAAPDFPGEP